MFLSDINVGGTMENRDDLKRIIEMELKDEEHLDERWCYPYRLCNMFNLAKAVFHFGDSFLLDTSIFESYDV